MPARLGSGAHGAEEQRTLKVCHCKVYTTVDRHSLSVTTDQGEPCKKSLERMVRESDGSEGARRGAKQAIKRCITSFPNGEQKPSRHGRRSSIEERPARDYFNLRYV